MSQQMRRSRSCRFSNQLHQTISKQRTQTELREVKATSRLSLFSCAADSSSTSMTFFLFIEHPLLTRAIAPPFDRCCLFLPSLLRRFLCFLQLTPLDIKICYILNEWRRNPRLWAIWMEESKRVIFVFFHLCSFFSKKDTTATSVSITHSADLRIIASGACSKLALP
jgi:hypothetical protein